MLSQFNRKELEEMAKRMKAASNAPKDPKMKALLTAQASTNKEETTSGLVFTRKRKILATTTEHSFSVGRAPFYHVVPSRGQTTPLNMVDV